MRVLALILLATLLGVSNSFVGVYLSKEEIQAADRRMNEKADADAKRAQELAGQQRAPAALQGTMTQQETSQARKYTIEDRQEQCRELYKRFSSGKYVLPVYSRGLTELCAASPPIQQAAFDSCITDYARINPYQIGQLVARCSGDPTSEDRVNESLKHRKSGMTCTINGMFANCN